MNSVASVWLEEFDLHNLTVWLVYCGLSLTRMICVGSAWLTTYIMNDSSLPIYVFQLGWTQSVLFVVSVQPNLVKRLQVEFYSFSKNSISCHGWIPFSQLWTSRLALQIGFAKVLIDCNSRESLQKFLKNNGFNSLFFKE